MRGFPKHLNTKQDYLNCLSDFPAETKKALQLLLDSRFSWFKVRELAEREVIPDDDNNRIVEQKDGMGEDAPTVRVWEEYKEDPNALLFIKGFTVGEVQEIINGISA